MARFRRTLDLAAAAAREAAQLWEVPRPGRDPRMALAELVGDAEVAAIEAQGWIRFHAAGDTGVGFDSQQDEVALAMAREIDVESAARGPVF